MEAILYIALFAPLVGSLFGIPFASKQKLISVGIFASLMLGFSFLASALLFVHTLQGGVVKVILMDWIGAGGLYIPFGFLVDSVSATMIFVVTLVSLCVHIYSIGYMSHDKSFNRFFIYLSAFVFSMLILVMSDNFAGLFIGWEGVGLCSWMLIGFWYERDSASFAANEAFIMNRIADLGMLLGIFLIYWTFGTLSYEEVLSSVYEAPKGILIAIGILLFVGAMGKSAQFPLHTWLADAMEGPTPVSALIHAATMVTAGVYLVIRANPLYTMIPEIGFLIASLGAFVALFAATMALVNKDLKRIIAYSTLSQLGYMFVAAGLEAYWIALFHLATHAFFKSLLFLGAGNVMHAMHDKLDISKMGALYRPLKITAILMILASIALAGIYPFSGFFSKDKILEAAFGSGAYILWGILLLGAFLTAFYSFRLIMLVFFGEKKHEEEHPYEAYPYMLYAMLPLGILAVFAGFFEPTFHHFVTQTLPDFSANLESQTIWNLIFLTSFVALSGIAFAVLKYKKGGFSSKWQETFIYQLLSHQYYIPMLYDRLFIQNYIRLAKVAWLIDKCVVDFVVDMIARFLNSSGESMQWIQGGNLSKMLKIMFFGVVVLLLLVLIFFCLYGGSMDYLLTLLIFFPFIGAILAIGIKENLKAYAVVISFIELGLALLLWYSFDREADGFQFVTSLPLVVNFGISYLVGVDGISLFLIVLSALISLIGFIYLNETQETKKLILSLLCLESIMIGVFCALDMILFYIFWELSLVPMLYIIGAWGSGSRIYAAVKFFLYTFLGSMIMLIGILFLTYYYFSVSGVWTFSLLEWYSLSLIPEDLQIMLFLAFFCGLAVKVPMFPFHTWLPYAHGQAPTIGSIILAAVLLKMGTYGFVRFSLPLFPDASVALLMPVAILSLIMIVYGAMVAFAQEDMKQVVAYSSISHMGVIMIGIFALNMEGISGSVFFMLSHGIISGALFMLVGMIYERRHTKMIAEFGGIAKVMPNYAAIFGIMMMASAGLPLTMGFVGEFLSLLGFFQISPILAGVAGISIIVGAIYMLNLYRKAFYGKVINQENLKLQDLDKREWSALLPLVAIVIWLGVYPKPILTPINKGVENMLAVMYSRVVAPETKAFLGIDLELSEFLQQGESSNIENLENLENSQGEKKDSQEAIKENNATNAESLQEEGR